MPKQPTRRQHYVWRHHLCAWEVDGKIAVLRKGANGFLTNPINAAVAKDFYRLPRLQESDLIFFDQFIASLPVPDLAKKVARGWMEPSIMATALRLRLASIGAPNVEAERAIEEYEIQADESYQSAIEGQSLALLDGLREGSVDFWRDDEQAAMHFAYFIALQHMRTKRMADHILADQLETVDQQALARRWPILRHILATNFGMTLFVERAAWRLRVIEAPNSVEFITADQPVMNLLPAASRNDMALYYPLSPRRAMILEHETNVSVVLGEDTVDIATVESLNRAIFGYAQEQVFGSSLSYLRDLDLN